MDKTVERLVLWLVGFFRPGVFLRRLALLGLIVAAILHVWYWAVMGAEAATKRRTVRHARRRRDTRVANTTTEAAFRAERMARAREIMHARDALRDDDEGEQQQSDRELEHNEAPV